MQKIIAAALFAVAASYPATSIAQPFWLIGQAGASTAAPENVFRQRPPSHAEAPPQAVPHVATYSTDRGEVRITRNGRWIRSDHFDAENVSTEVSDIDAGVSFRFSPAGAPSAYITVERSGAEQDYYTLTRTETDEQDTVLGEACRVVAWRRVRASAHDMYARTCVTADGVTLWYGLQSDRAFYEHMRVTRIERRRVRVRDIAPPPELLRWSTWRTRASDLNGSSDDDYRMDMQSPENASPATRSERKHGGWLYQDTRHSSWRRFLLTNGGLHLSYDGPTRLQVERLSIAFNPGAEAQRSEASASGTPMDRPPEIIAGERCNWIETTVTSHSRSLVCRSADGINLHDVYAGDGARGGQPWSVRATDLTRAPLPDADVAPPPEVFAWLAPYAR